MSYGNLERTIVAFHFWPACENCIYNKECQSQPKHPAFPHRWHWGKESASFPDGELILRSWVGTTAIGQPHTGCTSYTVAPHYVHPLAARHVQYLQLQSEKAALAVTLSRLERKPTWSAQDEATYARVFTRYKEMMERQAILRSTNVGALPVAVNG